MRFKSDTRVALVAALFLVVAIWATLLGAASAQAKSVASAGRAARAADHSVVTRARRLTACKRARSRNCAANQKALQRAGRRLHAAELQLRRLGRVASFSGGPRRSAPPRLRAVGHRLRWSGRRSGQGYLLSRKPAGQPAVYTVVRRTAVTPPAVPGYVVDYRVRTAVRGSRWSGKQRVAYAVPDGARPPATPPPPAAKATDAPLVREAGRLIAWDRVAGVDDYLLVTKPRGGEPTYSVVHGTAIAPAAVAGKRVRYAVRTMVVGSAWAVEIEPGGGGAVDGPPPSEAPAPPAPGPLPSNPQFEFGLVTGASLKYELPFLNDLGARTARTEFDSATPAAAMATVIEAYAKAGVRPLLLAGFHGRRPTAAEAANVATWAAAYGPGGTFWAGKGYPASVAPIHIEFGNETSYGWQYPEIANDPNGSTTTFYKSMAENYAVRFKAASEAIKQVNPRVDLLAVGEAPGRWGTWMNSIVAAVPDFMSHVGGWTVHPYGPDWQERIDDMLKETAELGGSDSIPLYMTELGIATDNGRCLSNNYGWDPCMTYDQAAAALTGEVRGIRSRYGARVRGMWLYVTHDQESPGTSSEREAYFGALTKERTAKGAYTSAVKGLLAP